MTLQEAIDILAAEVYNRAFLLAQKREQELITYSFRVTDEAGQSHVGTISEDCLETIKVKLARRFPEFRVLYLQFVEEKAA